MIENHLTIFYSRNLVIPTNYSKIKIQNSANKRKKTNLVFIFSKNNDKIIQ